MEIGDVFDDGCGNSCILLTAPEFDRVEMGRIFIAGVKNEVISHNFISYYYLDHEGNVQFLFKAVG